MEIKVSKQMRDISLEVVNNEEDEKEALAKALIFTQPDICGICQEHNIVWDAHKVKIKDRNMYTSIKRKCLSCGAVSTLGEFRAGGYFWKKWALYKKEGNSEETREQRYETIDPLDGESIPIHQA
jgi:hypothetical protein